MSIYLVQEVCNGLTWLKTDVNRQRDSSLFQNALEWFAVKENSHFCSDFHALNKIDVYHFITLQFAHLQRLLITMSRTRLVYLLI